MSMRTMGTSTVFIMKQLLKRKFDKAMQELSEHHTFSNDEPDFRLVLVVNAYEFASEVLEQELCIYKNKYKAAVDECEALKRKYEPKPLPLDTEDDDEFLNTCERLKE